MSVQELEGHLQRQKERTPKLAGKWRSRIVDSAESLFFSRSVGNATLGLSTEVRPGELLNVFRGQTPDGKVALLAESLSLDGPAGWLIRASSPESSAVLWGLAPRKAKSKILDCHETGTENCLDEIERFFFDGEKGRSSDRTILFAIVPSPTFFDSTPQLRTEVFLPNLLMTVGGSCARLARAPGVLEQAARWSQRHDDRICELMKDRLGLEFHREIGRPPELIGLSRILSDTLGTPPKNGLTNEISQKISEDRFSTKAKGYGWEKSNAADLLNLSRSRRVDFKRLKKWKEQRIKETKRRKEIEEKEKPGIKNFWRKTTQTHSY